MTYFVVHQTNRNKVTILRSNLIYLLITLLTLSATASPVENTDLTLEDIHQMELHELLNIYVKTAGKKEQPRDNVAATMYVITKQDIEENGFMTIAEALTMLPGIHMDRTWYIDRIVVRGEPVTDSKLLLMIDGQSMAMRGDYYNIFNGAGPIEIRDIERMEVILGPNSVLYGSGAFLGVVNIITKRAEDAFVNLNASTVGEYGAYASYGAELDDMHLSLSTGVQASEGDELHFTFPSGIPPNYTETSGTAEGYNTIDSIRAGATLEGEQFSLRTHYSDARIVWPDSAFDTDFNNAGSYYDVEYFSAQADFTHQLASDAQAMLRLYYINTEGAWRGVYNGLVYPTPGGSPLWLYGGESYGAEYRVTYTPSDALSLVSGIELTDTFDSYSADEHRDFNNASIFAMLDYHLNTALSFQGGARVEHYSFRDKEELLPQAAMIYKPIKNASLKLSYSRGFLVPNTWELQIADLINNDNLKPETVDNYEFIYSHAYKRFSHSLSLYHSRHKDLKIISDTGFAASSIAENSSHTRTFQGVDWQGTFRPFTQTTLTLGASYNDAQDRDEPTGVKQEVAGSYNLLGYLNIRHVLPDSSTLSLNAKYVDQPNTYEQIRSWHRIDLTWLKKDIYGFDLRLRAGNILDEDITTYAKQSGAENIPDHGRFFAIDLGARF